MIRGFYSARLGINAQQEHLNVIANNMANLNTVGFKGSRVSFADLMYQNLNRNTAENAVMVGHGVKINKTDLSMEQGALEPTGYHLDYAITQEGQFFAVRDAAGDISYTRAGNFILSADDSGNYYLADSRGNRILDPDGEDIEVEFEEIENKVPVKDSDGNIVKDADGNIVYNTFYGEGAPIVTKDMVGVFSFRNSYGLNQVGANMFVATDVSGEATVVEQPNIMAGFLEGSAVEVSNEMVKMIEASRAFSFNSRMVQVADEVEQTINNLR